jgi:hypothetical protein
MARTLGILWLVCALAGPIAGVVGSNASGRPVDLGQLATRLVIVNVVNAAVAWLYIWSYRVRCCGQAHFETLLPNLLLDAPLLCFAGVLVVLWFIYKPRWLEAWDDATMVIVTIAAVCAMFWAASAWMHKRPRLHLASLASLGIALGVIGLVLTIQGVNHDFEDLGPQYEVLIVTTLFSFPSFWMAVAFLRCLKTESAARNAS